jgi:hypothetical protein
MGVTDVHDRDHMLARMGVNAIDTNDLPSTDRSGFSGHIISGRVDQEFLLRQRDQLRAFLDAGKVVVYSGQMFRPWLPGAQDAVLVDIASMGGTDAVTYQPHAIVGDIDPAAFGANFVHGYYPTPEGAEALAALPDGKAVIYIDRTSSGGTILLHAGINFMTSIVEDVTVRGVIPQLIAWINAEAEARSAVGAGA